MADEERTERTDQRPRAVYETILVKAGRRDGKVALWDTDPQHPNPEHEIYVADGTPPVEAARTPEVERALADGRLVQANESDVQAFRAYADEQERRADDARREARDKMGTLGANPEPVEPPNSEAKRGPGRPAGSTVTSS